MTNKPMLSVEREVIEKALRDALTIRFDNDSHVTKLRALLDKPVLESQYEGMTQEQAQAVSDGVDEILHGEPAAQHHGKPVAKLHAERLTGKDGEYGVTVEDSEWFNSCRQTGGIFNLYAEPPAPVAVVIDIESAAKKIAERMDYPWECMPEQGRDSMRENAKAIVGAAMLNEVKT